MKMKQRGFTLIELLVVIAIIGILAAVILASLNSARSRARDAQRLSDSHEINTAIEMYFADNGFYPPSGGATAPNPAWVNSSDNSWNSLEASLQPYIPSLAKDPQQSTDTAIWGGAGPAYSYINCGTTYMYVFQLETAKGPDNGVYCVSDRNTFYQYGGPGANTTIKTIGQRY